MQYSKLGSSDLMVSRVCLGTMTWGIQNNQAEADAQIARALEAGINFIDTAEMYPIPPNQQTYGDTERIIGNWFKRHPNKRQDVILASKIVGNGVGYIRDGGNISAVAIEQALDESLARLNTDYIDVYQLHWPNRTSPHFAKHWPSRVNPLQTDVEQEIDGMRDILAGIKKAIDAGKIRHWGLSDDTPWGIQTFIRLCHEMGVPKPVSIQNEFSLLHAKDWPYLIETCVFEDVAYLPWSPLATGILSGKYLNHQRPEGSRWTFVQRNGLFRDTPQVHLATEAYVALAEEVRLTPSQLALAWVNHVPGVTSTIIGATRLDQLEEDLGAFELVLEESVLDKIMTVFKQYPMPF